MTALTHAGGSAGALEAADGALLRPPFANMIDNPSRSGWRRVGAHMWHHQRTGLLQLVWLVALAQAPHIAHRPAAGGDAPTFSSNAPHDEQRERVLTLPLSRTNILALSVLLIFSILGCVFLWKLVTRKKCNCKLCNQQYLIQEAIGSGGYGTVFTVKRTEDGTILVLKKIRVDDITDANFAQAEARELRTLKHPRIVGYSDDFIHVEFMSGMPHRTVVHLSLVPSYKPKKSSWNRCAGSIGPGAELLPGDCDGVLPRGRPGAPDR